MSVSIRSPHLERLEERLNINGQPCEEEQLASLIERLQPLVLGMDRQRGGGGPTFFEITTAAALLYFAEQKVDYAVVEVGMGGRLDSTNVCEPLISVITTISLDHTKQLGESLAAIARRKGGNRQARCAGGLRGHHARSAKRHSQHSLPTRLGAQ